MRKSMAALGDQVGNQTPRLTMSCQNGERVVSVTCTEALDHEARHSNITEPRAVTRVSCDTVFGQTLVPERNEESVSASPIVMNLLVRSRR